MCVFHERQRDICRRRACVLARFREGRAHVQRQATFWSSTASEHSYFLPCSQLLPHSSWPCVRLITSALYFFQLGQSLSQSQFFTEVIDPLLQLPVFSSSRWSRLHIIVVLVACVILCQCYSLQAIILYLSSRLTLNVNSVPSFQIQFHHVHIVPLWCVHNQPSKLWSHMQSSQFLLRNINQIIVHAIRNWIPMFVVRRIIGVFYYRPNCRNNYQIIAKKTPHHEK